MKFRICNTCHKTYYDEEEVFCWICNSCLSDKAEQWKPLRFDGFYCRDWYVDGKAKYYIRFFPDGTVMTVTINGQTKALMNWLTPDRRNDHPFGHWIIDGDRIVFDVRSRSGKVRYYGYVKSPDELCLSSHSYINGYNSYDDTYDFIPA